tara:strand:+ start:149 stop:487 length:339 start_codon:yes stop_codon:yes gene_type:complete
MGSFFQSENVKGEMQDIMDLQKELYKVIAQFPMMSDEAKWHHIETIKELLEKQQIMWTRITLSDDPEAKQMKKHLMKGSKELGFGDADLGSIFTNMRTTLDAMQGQIKKSWN